MFLAMKALAGSDPIGGLRAVNDGETKNGVLWAAMGEASGHFISAAVHDCCERGANAADEKPKLRNVAKLKKKE